MADRDREVLVPKEGAAVAATGGCRWEVCEAGAVPGKAKVEQE